MKFLVALCLVSVAFANPFDAQNLKPSHQMAVLGLNLTNQSASVPFNDGYIVGGVTAKNGQAPHQVSLQKSWGHFCGGSIISDEWILTAAHCVSGTDPSILSVRYNSLSHASGGQLVNVKKVITHCRYARGRNDYDVALLQLASKLTLGSANARAIGLTECGNEPTGMVTVTGWGTLKAGGQQLPAQLQIVTVPIVNRKTCKRKYGARRLTARMFCAGILATGGKDSCQGDSGGPVVASNGKLVGIVSWGRGCARPNYPGVYARVGSFIKWIKDNTA